MAKKNSLKGRKVTFRHGDYMVCGKVTAEKGALLVVQLLESYGGQVVSVHRQAVTIG